MDLDEWEYLPDDAFLDFHDHQTEKKPLFSFDSTRVFNMYHEYYTVQSPNNYNSTSSNKLASSSVPVQIQLLPPPSFVRSTQTATDKTEAASDDKDQDPLLSQVYFKKASWESEAVDMKLDSPRSPKFMHQTSTSSSDANTTGAKFEFDDYIDEAKVTSPRIKSIKQLEGDDQEEQVMKSQEKKDNNNFNIWKLSFTGIGAICSFGFAAATICILFLGSNHQSGSHKNLQKIYAAADDSKRIKEAVHSASKFDESFSAVKRVPLCRAHITSGGYYTSAL